MSVASGKCFLVTGPPVSSLVLHRQSPYYSLLMIYFFPNPSHRDGGNADALQGVGKTTLVMRVVESLRASHPELNIQGFYTREIREGSARVGFEVVTLDGRRGPLATSIASREYLRWPCVGKYRVDLPSFETIALPELEVKEGTDLFIIDEVGKMELFSSSFYPAVLRVFESNTPILATIPIPKYGRDIPEVSRLRNHPKATVYTLNTGNRDAIRETIYAQMVSLLGEQRMGQ